MCVCVCGVDFIVMSWKSERNDSNIKYVTLYCLSLTFLSASLIKSGSFIAHLAFDPDCSFDHF